MIIAFVSGLAGWTAAALIVSRIGGGVPLFAVLALALVDRRGLVRTRDRAANGSVRRSAALDRRARSRWRSSAGSTGCSARSSSSRACRRPAGPRRFWISSTGFFFGQVIGLASLVPGGFGSSDAFWIARLPFDQNVTAAALGAFRLDLLRRAVVHRLDGAAVVGDAHVVAAHRRRAADHRQPRWRRRRADDPQQRVAGAPRASRADGASTCRCRSSRWASLRPRSPACCCWCSRADSRADTRAPTS